MPPINRLRQTRNAEALQANVDSLINTIEVLKSNHLCEKADLVIKLLEQQKKYQEEVETLKNSLKSQIEEVQDRSFCQKVNIISSVISYLIRLRERPVPNGFVWKGLYVGSQLYQFITFLFNLL